MNVTDMTMKTVIFMHLHRTGGTTFLKLLDNIYDTAETYTINGKRFRESFDEFCQLPEERRKKYRLIKGHLFWGLHRFCPNETTYITLLRHPIEKVISQYYWHLRPECIYPIPPNMTLEEFLESGRFISTDNGMTRFIAGKDREDVEYGKCSQEMLDLAKNNLQRYFLAFGLTEYYDESLILFKKMLGWRQFPFYQKKNVHHKKPANSELSNREKEILVRYNHYDIELFEYARQLFENRVNKEGKSFQDEVSLFKQLNSGA
jgi:hypothetical protein